MCDVFLSYSRAENEALASVLYQRLSAAGLAVWWDRKCMPSRSLTFLQEIRLAVRDAERTVVIVDEPACRSEYVQAEWQYALAAGKPVVPLLRLESYDDLPPELAGLHCPDFRLERELDAAVEELLRVLSDEVPPLGRLLGEVPGIPPHYQPRVGATTRLAGEVMQGRNDPVTIIGAQRITVLHGMGGGAGKSVLAAALARSTATRQAFGDGIVWLAPDADSRPEGLLRGLGELLGGISRNWQTALDCVDGVRELLSGLRVLILIDNATSVGLIEPVISVLDVDTRVVVTTRFAGLADDLGARSLYLGDLELAEALQLLADWAGCSLDELPPAATQLAAQCAYLPFALAINGAMVRRGTPWQDLLDAFHEHELEFAQAHDRLANYPYRNVFRAIRPSIVELERSEPQALERLVELAAFHWAQGVPEAAVTQFWVARGCHSARAARKVMTELADRSLLRLDGDAPTRQVRLHDIQRDYLIATGADTSALGRALLDSYGSADSWPSVAPDAYFHQHVIRHLIELGDFAAIQRLMDTRNELGGNAWFEAMEVADNLLGYLDDLDRASAAWPQEKSDVIRSPISAALHHSLIRASINSMSSLLSAEMRTALLRTSLWSSGRALAEARQVADVDQRVRALLDVASVMAGAERKRALDEALDLARTRGKQQIPGHLVRTAQLLEPDRRAALLEEARAVARTITSPGYRATALARVAGQWNAEMRGAVIAEALDAAAEEVASAGVNQGGFDALGVLAAIVPSSSLPRLLDLVRQIPNNFGRAMAFAQLMPHVADPVQRALLAEEGAEVERSVEGNSVWIRVALALHLPNCAIDALFEEVVRTDDRHIGYLVSLLPEMSTQDAQCWLERVRAVAFTSEYSRFRSLFAILNRLDGAMRQRLLDELTTLAQQLPYDTWRSQAYDALAPALDARQLASALRVLRTIGDTHAIGSALARLLPQLDPALCAEAVDFVRDRVDGAQSLDVLVTTATAVERELREDVVHRALAAWRAGASFGGGVYSPDLAIDTLVQLARMADMPDRIAVLQHLVDEIFGGRWGAVTGARGLVAAAEFLAPEFVDRCAAQLAQQALDETLHATTQSIEGTHTGRSEVLASTFHVLAPVLTSERANAFLELADAVPDEGWKMAAYTAVTTQLPEIRRSEVLLALIVSTAHLDVRVQDPALNLWKPLVWLAKVVPEQQRAPIIKLAIIAARAVGESWRSAALASTVGLVEGSLRDEIIDEALALGDDYSVPKLVPYLGCDRAWTVARRAALSTVAWSANPSLELAEVLATGEPAQRHELWQELTTKLRNLTRADLCSRYVALAPLLRSVGEPKALGDLARSLIASASWWK